MIWASDEKMRERHKESDEDEGRRNESERKG